MGETDLALADGEYLQYCGKGRDDAGGGAVVAAVGIGVAVGACALGC